MVIVGLFIQLLLNKINPRGAINKLQAKILCYGGNWDETIINLKKNKNKFTFGKDQNGKDVEYDLTESPIFNKITGMNELHYLEGFRTPISYKNWVEKSEPFALKQVNETVARTALKQFVREDTLMLNDKKDSKLLMLLMIATAMSVLVSVVTLIVTIKSTTG